MAPRAPLCVRSASANVAGVSGTGTTVDPLAQVVQTIMGLLAASAGPQDDDAADHLREAASLVFFRVMLLVALERRGLLWRASAAESRARWLDLEQLAAQPHSDAAGHPLLRGLLYRGLEVRSAAPGSPLAIHGLAIFRARPTAEFHPRVERWLAPLDALDVAAPRLPAALRARWEVALATAVAASRDHLGAPLKEDAIDLGASAHALRALGDAYERILGMQPARAAASERHALGAHYTPGSLIDEVVRAALDPLLKSCWRRAGGAPATDPSRRPPRADAAVLDAYERELLGLRIVDPAMGCGHFLTVTAVELARELAYMRHFGAPQPANHFEVAAVPRPWTKLDDPGHGGEPGLGDRLDAVAAARLPAVISLCCHGVDRKPLAVELGKLALWLLTTLARRRVDDATLAALPGPPPNFLDANLRSGDSLLGLTRDDAPGPHEPAWKWDLAVLRRLYNSSKAGRLERALGVASVDANAAPQIYQHARELGVFHWPLAFSAVFARENHGFDGVVANPPFKGDRDLRAAIGEDAVAYLRDGAATLDLCGFFIRRFDDVLGVRGTFSTVAPNSIGQGRNRTAGLRPLITGERPRFVLYRAVQTMPWPGDAAVQVALLAARRPDDTPVLVREVGATRPRALRPVAALSSFLDGGVELALRRLPSGAEPLAFTGMFPRGPFDIALGDPRLAAIATHERAALFAYLNNKDIQSQPRPRARRAIVDTYAALVAAGQHRAPADRQEAWLREHLPRTMALLEPAIAGRRALPASARNTRARAYPWQFEEVRPGLRAAWSRLASVIAIGAVGKTIAPLRLPRRDPDTDLEVLPTHQLFIVPSESCSVHAVLSAAVFETFARRVCSTLEDRLRFVPSQVFPFFPLPWAPTAAQRRLDPLAPPAAVEKALGPAVRSLLEHRQAVLDLPAKHGLGRVGDFGPTRLYNLFDDPSCALPAVQRLRERHVALTRAVLDAYGWTDLEPTWEFGAPWVDGTTRFFPDARTRAELLARLQALNHERHALELGLCERHDIPVGDRADRG